MRLHLIDATLELFRAYYGLPSIEDPTGREVAAVRGLVGSVLNFLRDEEVTHVAAATDRVIRSFRNDLWAGYKTEEGVPEDLLAQFPIAERALRAMGVVVWAMEEYEADDAMATAVERFAPTCPVVLVSSDKDLAQCVQGDRVVMLDRQRERLIDEEAVLAKFGVAPASIPDYLALVGDAADGLPGVPGWGAKSTATVLGAYRHLEAVPLDPARWEPPVRGAARLADSLREHLPEALLFRYLATLRRDVPLEESMEDLAWRGVPRAEFLELCEELGSERLRERPSRWR